MKKLYPSFNTQLKEGGWKELVDYFAPFLQITIEQLISIAKATYLNEAFQHSRENILYFNRQGIVICSYKISPFDVNLENETSVYHKNANVKSRTGLHLMADLFTRYYNKGQPIPCGISIKLEISGHEAYEAFKKMHTNYRRLVELLLNKIDAEFCTNVVIDSIEKYRGKDIIRKIDLYYAEDDEECYFWFECNFFQDTEDKVIIRSFLILCILYDACFHYITKRKDYDRLLSLFAKAGTSLCINKD